MSKTVRGILASFVALVGLVGLTAAGPAERAGDPRQVWTHLPSTRNNCDNLYDYFPGGMRILWCHAKQDISAAQVEALAGVPIWASGPHQKGAGFDLDNTRTFGHYNPEFVKKLPSFAIPGIADTAFRKATQSTYDSSLKELARTSWKVHATLKANPACAKREFDGYKANLESANPTPGYHERWYDFFGEGEASCGGANVENEGNVTKTVVAWWMRRKMDGTEAQWAEVLKKLLATYDPSFPTGG
jgi:hypothetical protein